MEQDITYAFGQFRLQTVTQLLCYEGETFCLQPKVYSLLLYFLQHAGRLVSRKELFSVVWQGRVVEDTALRLAINSLRKALHDESKTPRYILTTCKYGYRFLPEVRIEANSQPSTISPQALGFFRYQPKTGFPDTAQTQDTELAQMLVAFEQAADGKRNFVFLSGERGIGKTALLERFLANIRHTDFGVLRCRCVPLDDADEPFLPILEALELRCNTFYGKQLVDCLHRFAPTWLNQIPNMLESNNIKALPPKTPHLSTGRMLREGADFFETLGNKSIFILILDNSHWSDNFTLDLLNFLAFRCTPAKLLMIVSYRLSQDSTAYIRLERMKEELRHRGLCMEITMKNSLTILPQFDTGFATTSLTC